MRTLLALIVAICTASAAAATGGGPAAQPVPAAGATPALDEARRHGWENAKVIVAGLSQRSDLTPGITAFLDAFRRAQAEHEAASKEGRAHVLDADALVTRSPVFWRATYEVAPGDPLWLALHASLLLAAGEASRASQVAALAHAAGNAPDGVRRGLRGIVAQAESAQKEGRVLVNEGVEAFDAGKRAKAAKAYQRAIAAWPENGLAHYELGLTHLAEGTQPAAGEEFALAKRHDPLQWMAYQGEGDAVPRLKAMVGRVMPVWEKLTAASFARVDDADLSELSLGLQEAQADELALVVRQLVVQRRRSFAPEDHPFITASLRRLAPGPVADATLDRLAGAKLTVLPLVTSSPAP